jgi:hypothetical protein
MATKYSKGVSGGLRAAQCSANGPIRNPSTATVEMISTVHNTATRRLFSQSILLSVEFPNSARTALPVLKVKKKNGLLSGLLLGYWCDLKTDNHR